VETILAKKTDPLIIQGSVPYVFPFASVLPESDRFNIGLKINDESLKILDLITNQQLIWQGGQGQIIANLEGRIDPQTQTVKELNAQGLGEIKNATIAAQFFPKEPLTNINGKLTLDLDHLRIQQLTGQFSGGDLTISGDLPLQQESLKTAQPLLVSLNNLKVKLIDFYEGNVRGNVQITGTLLKPQISGDLELVKGEVAIGDTVPVLSTGQAWQSQTEFKNFGLTLGEEVRVTSLILDFLAQGKITLNGTINKLEPEGRIYLKAGLVNLFASQLRLVGGEENTVQFYPARGLDPYLNVQLSSAVTETNRNLVATNPQTSIAEIDLPFSANRESLQGVRITAKIQGYSSELNRSLQLTSVPRRSQREIVALLGGDLANTLGQGDATSGLANLAGSAVLGPLQGRIGEALGLSQFRIFSTPLINEKERTQANQLGVAAEAGIDLTPDLSLSVQKIINADRPPQWGIKYRINENLRVRGSSNFADDNRGIIEYEQRF
ncbi:MAG: translocation/assembly module TamB domain-containing protein, partial [Microcystaceae cyanobacterium]